MAFRGVLSGNGKKILLRIWSFGVGSIAIILIVVRIWRLPRVFIMNKRGEDVSTCRQAACFCCILRPSQT